MAVYQQSANNIALSNWLMQHIAFLEGRLAYWNGLNVPMYLTITERAIHHGV
jgi:hypothetical protein